MYMSGVKVQMSPTLNALLSVIAVLLGPQNQAVTAPLSSQCLNCNGRQSGRRDLDIKGCSRSYRGSVEGLGIENSFCFQDHIF